MEYVLTRVRHHGHVVPKRVRQASTTRGTVAVREERSSVRNRTMLVATFTPTDGQDKVPPLYDVALLGTSGDSWALSGFESVPLGPLGGECSVAQTWLLRPGPLLELEHADAQWKKLALELHELRCAVGQSPAAPAGVPSRD